MNCKRKGTRNEHKTIKLLSAAGYECIRSAASLGPFDVIGISANDFVLVQVKSNRNASAVEIETIRSLAVPSNCRKLIHIWKDGERTPITKTVE